MIAARCTATPTEPTIGALRYKVSRCLCAHQAKNKKRSACPEHSHHAGASRLLYFDCQDCQGLGYIFNLSGLAGPIPEKFNLRFP